MRVDASVWLVTGEAEYLGPVLEVEVSDGWLVITLDNGTGTKVHYSAQAIAKLVVQPHPANPSDVEAYESG